MVTRRYRKYRRLSNQSFLRLPVEAPKLRMLKSALELNFWALNFPYHV